MSLFLSVISGRTTFRFKSSSKKRSNAHLSAEEIVEMSSYKLFRISCSGSYGSPLRGSRPALISSAR